MFEAIAVPIIMIVIMGLLVGFILTICSNIFKVKENETTAKVREALPGANCGACGYSGCDGYAKAVSEEDAEINLCVPGGDALVKQLGEIMGKSAESAEKKIAFIACRGDKNKQQATAFAYEYKGEATCKACAGFYGGNMACSYGCLGFGDCATACPYGAITVKDNLAHVSKELCIGCGLCAAACPKHIISLLPLEASYKVACSSHDTPKHTKEVCINGCIGCKICEKKCPNEAISVTQNLARIDTEKCTGCKICQESCPVKVII